MTAHSTEAKRITVLEIHRRIYRELTELDQPRWARPRSSRSTASRRAWGWTG